MKLIIGLGNPGEEYKKNRHNVGHVVVDSLSKSPKLKNSKQIKIFKSKNFMNKSGEFVKKLVDQYGVSLSNLWIIHDDLDIRLGNYKIHFGKGPKIHKGLSSIDEVLGTSDYWHVRIGVDNRDPNNRIPGEEYVLEDFTNEENEILKKVIDKVTDDLYERLKG